METTDNKQAPNEIVIENAKDIESFVKGNKHVMKRLIIVFSISAIFTIIEIVGGILAGSIALLSDAAHMFSDLLGFVIAIISVWISGFPANKKHSYGFHRAGVLGALVSILVIWILTGFLIYFAALRVINIDEIEVEGKLMFGVACLGLLMNIVMIKALHGGHGHHHGHKHGHGHRHKHGKNHKKHKTNLTDRQEEGKFEENNEHPHPHHDAPQSIPPLEEKFKDECLDHDHKHNVKKDFEQANHQKDDNFEEIPLKIRNKEGPNQNVGEININFVEKRMVDQCSKSFEIFDERKVLQVPKLIQIELQMQDSNPEKKTDNNQASTANLSKASVKDNLNVRATIIHILGDLLQSIGVIIASVLIWISPDLKLADPIITFFFAIIILFTTVRVVRDCIFVLMEGTPRDINVEEFEGKIKKLEGVIEIHDLHIWSLSEGKPAMSAHIFTDCDFGLVLKKTTDVCRMYGIYHSTIQIEVTQDKESHKYVDCNNNIH